MEKIQLEQSLEYSVNIVCVRSFRTKSDRTVFYQILEIWTNPIKILHACHHFRVGIHGPLIWASREGRVQFFWSFLLLSITHSISHPSVLTIIHWCMLMSYEPSYWIYWFLPWFFWDSNVVRRNNAKVSGWASSARPQVELGSDYAWSVSTLQALQHSLQQGSPQVKLRSYLAQLKHSKRAHSLVWVLIKRSRRAASHNRETLSIAAISFCPPARSNKAQVTASMWERDLEVIAI